MYSTIQCHTYFPHSLRDIFTLQYHSYQPNKRARCFIIILIKEQAQVEEFNFTCHNYQDTKYAKILFGMENSNTIKNYSATRVLQSFVLEPNYLGTNTKPYPVKCENVCQVNLVVTYFDATSIYCNETQIFLSKVVW